MTMAHKRRSTARAALSARGHPFNGLRQYSRAFRLIRDNHIALSDAVRRERWCRQWQHRYDDCKLLSTPHGADRAIERMLASLGYRYDSYYKQDDIPVLEQEDPTIVGTGTICQFKGLKRLLKLVPKNATEKESQSILRFSDEHPLQVQVVIKEGPADKAGIREGDIITHIDGNSVNGLTQSEASNRLRGKKGSVVQLTVERSAGGNKTTLVVPVTRAPVTHKVVRTKQLDNNIAYIQLTSFVSDTTLLEMITALKGASSSAGVILDLRNNGGGMLQHAMAICHLLLEEGNILTLRLRDGDGFREESFMCQPSYGLKASRCSSNPKRVRTSSKPRLPMMIPADMPLVVLVNEESASASEIVAGVLQGRRATIVGTPTCGKGEGQAMFLLPGGRMLHITNGEFLPAGKDINWVGIIPDVEAQDDDSDDDLQLAKALEVLESFVSRKETLEARKKALKDKNEHEFAASLKSKR